MAHGYDGSSPDLSFVGIANFGKRPFVADWSNIDANVAGLGAPVDAGSNIVPVRGARRELAPPSHGGSLEDTAREHDS